MAFGLPASGRARILDIALASVLTLALQIEILLVGTVAGRKELVAPLFLLQTVPLVWRRSAPLLVIALNAGSGSLQVLAAGEATEGGVGLLAFTVAIYSLGTYGTGRQLAVGGPLAAAAYLIHELNNNIETEVQVWSAIVWAMVTALLLGLGIYVRRYRQARVLGRRMTFLEREREERAEAAVADERARIARELHDIVGHSVSVMVVQAEAAEAVLELHPERVGEPLVRIQRTGREALDELRRLLGIMREDGARAALAPQPGIGSLERLVREFRGAGVTVGLRIEGEPRKLPAGLDLAVYRLVQEALTNSLKHGGGANASVLIRLSPDSVEVEIADDGPGAAAGSEAGHGLVGMRERVQLYGGELVTGPRPEGGYLVRARLPLLS